MRRLLLPALLVGALGLWPKEGRSQPLPAPRPVPPVVMPPAAPFPPPPPYRRSAYEVWQYYDVNNTGWWLPLVIDNGLGGAYRYQGIPFTGVPTRMINYMPYARDSP